MGTTLIHPTTIVNLDMFRDFDFNQLLDQHHDRLYWMIRKIVLVHSDAEDVLQNTWIKIHKGLPNFKGESKIETWMFRIAYNECMRFLKRKKHAYRLDEIDSSYIEILKADVYFDADKASLKLQNALAILTERERHVFNLKCQDGLKFKAIAKLLEMNPNSVKTIYYKTERKIKRELNIFDQNET